MSGKGTRFLREGSHLRCRQLAWSAAIQSMEDRVDQLLAGACWSTCRFARDGHTLEILESFCDPH